MTKISALSDIGTSVASNDTFVLVDVSDPTTPNKKIQQQNLFLIPDGSAGTPGLRFLSDTNVGLFRPTTDTLAIVTGGSERLRIDSSGRLGLGTSSPGAAFDCFGAAGGISNPANGTINVVDNTAAALGVGGQIVFRGQFQSGAYTQYGAITAYKESATVDGSQYGASLVFNTRTQGGNNTEKMRIDSSGRVGIGTTSPVYTLDCRGTFYAAVASGSNNITLGDTSNGTQSTIRTSNNNLIFSANASAESFRVDSSSRLLVGTSTSASTGCALQVRSDNGLNAELFRSSADGGAPYLILSKSRGTAASPALVSSGDTVGYQSYRAYDGSAYIEAARILAEVDGTPGANDMPGRLVFSTTADGASSPTERMRISNAGNVGINATPSTSYRLLAKTSSAIESALGTQGVTGDTATQSILVTKFDNDTTTAQNFIQFQVNNGGANCGRITANGANTAAFGSTSDIRLKENIEDLPPQLENILGLRPVEFDYIESEGGGHQIGFIAQEMQQIYPDVVNERGEDDMLMITGWSKTEARLVKALQEAVAKIETLEAKVAALEGA